MGPPEALICDNNEIYEEKQERDKSESYVNDDQEGDIEQQYSLREDIEVDGETTTDRLMSEPLLGEPFNTAATQKMPERQSEYLEDISLT